MDHSVGHGEVRYSNVHSNLGGERQCGGCQQHRTENPALADRLETLGI
jgi:hypothetical protein